MSEEEYPKVTGSKFRPKASVLPPSPSQEEAQAVNPLDVKPGVQVFASFVCGEVSILTLPGNRGKGDRLARQVWVHEQRPDGGEDFLAQVLSHPLEWKGHITFNIFLL